MTLTEFAFKLRRVTLKKIINKLSYPLIRSIQSVHDDFLKKQQIKQYYRERRGQKLFSADWFSNNEEPWSNLLNDLKNKPNIRALEIGSYEGRSTCWLMENILTHLSAKLYCIDTLAGSMEHQEDQVNMETVKRNFFHNISPYRNKVKVFLDTSQNAIRKHPEAFPMDFFDLIYIDGSHTAYDTLEDAILCFRLLKTNGIMIFDDYEWHRYAEPHLNPQLGIDSWLACFTGQYEIISKGYQLCVRKS